MDQWSAVLVMILYHTAILLHDISITMFFNSISMFVSVAAIHLHFDIPLLASKNLTSGTCFAVYFKGKITELPGHLGFTFMFRANRLFGFTHLGVHLRGCEWRWVRV